MDTPSQEVLWKVYRFVLSCGNEHQVKPFALQILEGLKELCPSDQSRIYFYDRNGKLCDQYLVGVDRRAVNDYHEYYSKVEGELYSVPKKIHQRIAKDREVWKLFDLPDAGKGFVRQIVHPTLPEFQLFCLNWNLSPKDEFRKDYISSLNITYSTGFGLYDITDSLRVLFMLDRTRTDAFSEHELFSLLLSIPLLENLFANMSQQQKSVNREEYLCLTKREKEIADLLCDGVSSENISKLLYISKATTYKHISNIFRKLNVSSRYELLSKLLGD